MAGARPHRAEPGASSRPTKGGAVRIRIALTTAVAVIAIPVVLFAMFSSPPAASARVTGHEATSRHGAVKINLKLMSYAEAEKVAKTATFHSAPTARQKATSPADLAFIKAVAVQLHEQAAVQAAAAAAAARAQAAAAAASAAAAPLRLRARSSEHHHPGRMVGDGHLRRRRTRRPVRGVLRDPRVARLRRLPDRRQRAAVGAAGLGGTERRRTARRTGAVPQLLSSGVHRRR